MDFSNTAYQVILGFDAVIVAILLAILYRYGKRRDGRLKIDVLKMKALKSSLDQALSESQRTSQALLDILANHIHELNGILREMDIKEKKLEQYLKKSEKMLDHLREHKKQQNKAVDPYTQAAELISLGMPADDIQRQCGLSLNEIDLIMQIGRNRAQ